MPRLVDPQLSLSILDWHLFRLRMCLADSPHADALLRPAQLDVEGQSHPLVHHSAAGQPSGRRAQHLLARRKASPNLRVCPSGSRTR